MPEIRPLSTSLAQKAVLELNESPERMEADLQAIRDWLKKCPHIKARTDDQFLVAFLRGCKYSLEKVKEKLDMYYTVRTAIPELMANRDPLDARTLSIIKLGCCLPLLQPYAADAPLVVMIRIGAYDPNCISVNDIIAVGNINADLLMMMDDNYAVAGQILVFDMENITMAHILQLTPLVLKKLIMLLQEGVPIRQKAFHFINVPSAFLTIYNLAKTLLTDKLKKRMMLHKSLEDLHKYIPKKIFPQEYAGEKGPISKLIAQWEQIVMSKRKMLLDDKKFGIDEGRRPGKSRVSDFIFDGIEGSFRKLTVD